MSETTDRLFAEVDLRLSRQQARADALANRAGVMVGAIAVAASLLASDAAKQAGPRLLTVVFLTMGLAALAGIGVLCMGRLGVGPLAAQLTGWAGSSDGSVVEELFVAKAVTAEANDSVLTRVEVVFYVQALSTALSTGLALYVTGKG